MESVPVGNKKCGTCKHWDGNRPPREQRFTSNGAGYKCLYKTPFWVRESAWSQWTLAYYGVDCPTWEKNDQSKVQGDRSGDT